MLEYEDSNTSEYSFEGERLLLKQFKINVVYCVLSNVVADLEPNETNRQNRVSRWL